MEHLDLHKELSRLQVLALVVGVTASALCGLAWFNGNEHFYHSYLMAYLFWFGLSAGSIGLLFIHHMAGGRWGALIQRPMEAAAKTMPLMALLFVPIVLGLPDLYRWARPEAATNELLLRKAMYLNASAFIGRAAFYFLVWTFLAFLLSRWSRRQDETNDQAWGDRLHALSGPGLVAYVLTASLAGIDWGMSLEPDWWSTMYAPLFMVSQGLSTLCVMAIAAHRMAKRKPVLGVATHLQFHDIGNMIFAFTILWMYMNIAQYIIIWSGNLPEEDVFYLDRKGAGWPSVALILFVFHFAIPFVLLLNKVVKRHSRILAEVAALIIVMCFVDLYWLVTPTFHKAISYHWLVFAAPFAVGGLWCFVFLALLKSGPVLPTGDRRIKELLAAQAAGHH